MAPICQVPQEPDWLRFLPGMLPVTSSCTQEGSALHLTVLLDLGKHRDIKQKQRRMKATPHPHSPRWGAPKDHGRKQLWSCGNWGPPEPQQLFCKMGQMWTCPPGEVPREVLGKGTPCW